MSTTKKTATKRKPAAPRIVPKQEAPPPANPDPNAGLTRRTVHMGTEYTDALSHAKALGKPYTAGFIIRETLKRHMDAVVATFKAAKGG